MVVRGKRKERWWFGGDDKLVEEEDRAQRAEGNAAIMHGWQKFKLKATQSRRFVRGFPGGVWILSFGTTQKRAKASNLANVLNRTAATASRPCCWQFWEQKKGKGHKGTTKKGSKNEQEIVLWPWSWLARKPAADSLIPVRLGNHLQIGSPSHCLTPPS